VQDLGVLEDCLKPDFGATYDLLGRDQRQSCGRKQKYHSVPKRNTPAFPWSV